MEQGEEEGVMPWTNKQVRLFAAAAHDPGISKRQGIPMGTAHKMLMEAPASQRSSAMKKKKAHPLASMLRGR